MFGFVVANLEDVSEQEKARYNASYCGLCHTIKDRYGQQCCASLSFDLVFLAMLLSSLYEPKEESGTCNCIMHPVKEMEFSHSVFSEYAADLTVLLAYHKCKDDWSDDKKITARSYQAILEKPYRIANERRQHQGTVIEQTLRTIGELERTTDVHPDTCANLFGSLMGELFVYEQDFWAESLYRFGSFLGRFIYFMDAAVDVERDRKSGNYNPFVASSDSPEDTRMFLSILIGDAAAAFEKLPLENDVHLMRSILYAGVWQQFNQLYPPETLPETASGNAKSLTSRLRPFGRKNKHE